MDTQSLVKNKWRIKSTQLFVVAGTVLITLLISLICIGLTVRYEVDSGIVDTESIQYWKLNLPKEQDVWYEKGIEELRSIIMRDEQQDAVENVIILIAEGVNMDILARSRFMSFNESMISKDFIWDTFPYVAILKNRCSIPVNCDDFSLGTSLFGGVKTNLGLGGLDSRVGIRNCSQAINETYHIHSILKQAKDLNLRTGFVTTDRPTGPLVAALYAHISDSQWECKALMPTPLQSECEDVTTQLINSNEAQRINVIMGSSNACYLNRSRNLLSDWQSLKIAKQSKFDLLESSEDLNSFNGSLNDYVLGLFAFDEEINAKEPMLQTMVHKSLDVLNRNQTGYVFVVETAMKSYQLESVQNQLWMLDDVIKATFKHPRFSAKNTMVLTVFLDDVNSSKSNDILVYATGPNSFLFHGIHEETYMAHVVSHSLKMGPFRPITTKK